MIAQRTLARPVSMRGKGLHCGRWAEMTIHPAPPATGVVFSVAAPGGGRASIAASWRNAIATPLCSTLEDAASGVRLRTVEHLLAAFAVAGIDNALVEIAGEEVPICDGSAAPLLSLLDKAGPLAQDAPRRYIRILRPIELGDGHSEASLRPAASPSLDLTLPLPAFGLLQWRGELEPERLRREIVPARTFGWLPQALPGLLFGRFARPPLLRGASLASALVMAGRRPLNPKAMPIPDELVRHRVLDAIGDLALAGAPILGAIRIHRTRHSFMLKLMETLFATPDAWEWTEDPQSQTSEG